MIVGFSKYGTGASKGPVQYLTAAQSPDGTLRTPPPEVLRGDPALVGALIDRLPFTYKYTSGCLSFAPGEALTAEEQTRIMDAFERTAFAGLARDQYSILWVRHRHAGHLELNFLVARVELSSGKSLNIAPPGKATRELFDTFRSMVNAELGLADPDDPARARDVSLPNHIAKLRADASRKGQQRKGDIREGITLFVRREVDAGRITDRDGVVAYLTREGFQVPRAGTDYITVLDPATGERTRLKGGLYSKERFDPAKDAQSQIRYGVPDPARAAALATTLETLAAVRARYHQTRYGTPGDGTAQARTPSGPHPPGQGMERLEDVLRQALGDDAITPVNDGGLPARSSQRRRRRQQMQQAIETIGKGADDGIGGTVAERLAAVGPGLQRARAALASTLEQLADAAGRWTAASAGLAGDRAALRATGGGFIRTGRAFAAGLDAALEERWWERFYGRDDREPER